MLFRKSSQDLIQLINKNEEFNNVILVEGARQVGKTTLVRDTLNRLKTPFKEINLEFEKVLQEKIDLCNDFSDFSELIQVELNFKVGGSEVLFIDEAQESRKLGSFVRFMKEKWPRTRVILSGSSMSRLFRDDVRYPVGRVTSLLLKPFSFEEFLSASGQTGLLEKLRQFPSGLKISSQTHERFLEFFEKYLEVGGLPEVVLHYFQGASWHQTRENILLGYYNDFKRVFGEEQQPYFIASLKATASLLGSPFKNSYVSRFLDGGKNRQIIECLGRLESWRMILKVDQKGPTPERQFHPKRYLFDIGIAKELRESALPLLRISKSFDMVLRTSLGGTMENVIACLLATPLGELTGWKKSSSGSEIDFVIKFNEKIIPIECKAASSVKMSHLGGVIDFMETCKSDFAILAALAPFEIRELPKNRKILILPIYLAEYLNDLLAHFFPESLS